MIALGTHWEYIVGGYAAAALVVAAMIAWIALDARTQKRRATELEAARARRRAS